MSTPRGPAFTPVLRLRRFFGPLLVRAGKVIFPCNTQVRLLALGTPPCTPVQGFSHLQFCFFFYCFTPYSWPPPVPFISFLLTPSSFTGLSLTFAGSAVPASSGCRTFSFYRLPPSLFEHFTFFPPLQTMSKSALSFFCLGFLIDKPVCCSPWPPTALPSLPFFLAIGVSGAFVFLILSFDLPKTPCFFFLFPPLDHELTFATPPPKSSRRVVFGCVVFFLSLFFFFFSDVFHSCLPTSRTDGFQNFSPPSPRVWSKGPPFFFFSAGNPSPWFLTGWVTPFFLGFDYSVYILLLFLLVCFFLFPFVFFFLFFLGIPGSHHRGRPLRKGPVVGSNSSNGFQTPSVPRLFGSCPRLFRR